MKTSITGPVSLLLMLTSVPAASAADSIGVVAVAEPPGPSPELAELTHQLRQVLAERTQGIIDANELRERMTGNTSSAMLSELERAYAGALATYQNGDFEGAVSTLRAVIGDLERLPASPEAFRQWTRAMLRLARSEQTVGRGGEAREVLDRLVRGNPMVKADVNQYPPSFVKQVEDMKEQVAKLVKRRLTVKATAKGAKVFVEGREVGVTPLTLELPPGRYRVSGAVRSLHVPAVIADLTEEGQSIMLNFALADALRPGFGPGLALSQADRTGKLVGAGAWLGVDKLVAAQFITESGVEYLAATMFDVRRGMPTREGRVRLNAKIAPAGSLTALAAFLITGQTSSLVAQTQVAPSPADRGKVAKETKSDAKAAATDKKQSLEPNRQDSKATGSDLGSSPEAVSPGLQAEDGASGGGILGRLAKYKPYVAAQLGASPTLLPVQDSHGTGKVGFDTAIAVTSGLRWTSEWALEVGLGFNRIATSDYKVDRNSECCGALAYEANTTGWTLSALAGGAWAPRSNPYVSVAADVGVATAHYSYDEWALAGNGWPPALAAKMNGWEPRLGAELRLDYPMRWVTIGVRAGITALYSSGRGMTTWVNPNGVSESSTWLEPGWILGFPVSASVRYPF